MNKIKGLRIITNLDCNVRCAFCFQGYKPQKRIRAKDVADAVREYVGGKPLFEYTTIMGGESTLLPQLELLQFVSFAASVTAFNDVRLTTNGHNLTDDLLYQLFVNGLGGINISIASLSKYREYMVGSKLGVYEIIEKVALAKKYFPSLRINIPVCKYSLDGGELELMLSIFSAMGCGITLCEDIDGTYTLDGKLADFGLKFIEDTGFGLAFLDFRGHRIGWYRHKDNYKNTDLIVSPVGVFTCWDGYCEAVAKSQG